MKDYSGTITTGGTSQELLPEKPNRRGFLIQNLSEGDLWISPFGDAAAESPSLKIAAGGFYETPTSWGGQRNAVSIFGATTGQEFTCWEW
jgi:hypothetical protein